MSFDFNNSASNERLFWTRVVYNGIEMRPLLQTAAAPVASVVMLLTLIAAMGAWPTGLPVGVVSGYPQGTLCVEQRLVIVRVEPQGRLFINSEPVLRSMLESRLERIFATRAERAAFVLGSPELSVGEVAEVIAAMRPIVWNVGLLTPSTIPTIAEPLLSGTFPVKKRWQ